MAAMRATARASPFLFFADFSEMRVCGREKRIVDVAVALRNVGVLWAMEIICAEPLEVRCDRGSGAQVE